MPYGLIDYNTLKDIGDAIREKTNSDREYYPRDMARAIGQIKTAGMGFDQPIALYISNNYGTYYPPFSMLKKFEQLNRWDNNYSGTVIKNIEWTGMSPDKLNLYFRMDGPNIIYGLLVDGNNWAVDQSTIIDISNLFSGASMLLEPYCGKYTSNMHNTYMYCTNLVNSACGDYVVDLSNAYYSCYNLRNATCGNLVENMYQAYAYCTNLTNAVVGPNVINASGAFMGCTKLTGYYTIPSTVKDITNMFRDCNNISYINGNVAYIEYAESPFPQNVNCDWANFHWGSLNAGQYLYTNKNDILQVGDFPSLYNGSHMFENCYDLIHAGYFGKMGESGANASHMFANCYNLSQASHDAFMANIGNGTNLSETFYGCQNIKNVHISENINANLAAYMYKNADIENITFDNNVTSVGNILTGSGIINAVCSDYITDMSNMYANCYNLRVPDIGNNVISMFQAYQNCQNIITAMSGPKVVNMDYSYAMCENLTMPACGVNVTSMNYAYRWCYNLTTAVCGDKVTSMAGAYENCLNLVGDITIPNANVLAQAFYRANNLQNIAILSDSINANKMRIDNAFYRVDHNLTRNIVLTNYNSYLNFISTSYNAVGYMPKEEITYDNIVEVNVDNIIYNAVRCAYNTLCNTYIYCTE